jgi:hypothetical protein
VRERFEVGDGLVVRRVVAGEVARFDALLDEHHWLGRGLVGETVRQVAVMDGEWVALVGWGSPAFKTTARDQWVGWTPAQRTRRLRFVANNQRFCVLPSGRVPNLASATLGAALRSLPDDWEAMWGHPVVLAETFTDPARHVGSCYRAANFAMVGQTAGWGRSNGSYAFHGNPKAVWVRELRRHSRQMLAGVFDHPVFTGHPKRSPIIDCNLLDFESDAGLLARLDRLPEHRAARGIRHSVSSIIAVAIVATMSGAKSYRGIGEAAADLPQDVLERLGCKYHPVRGCYIAPSENTLRTTLQKVDGDALDTVVGAWIADQDLTARVTASVDSATSGSDLVGVAVDGKWLRGTGHTGADQVKLFAGLLHHSGGVIGQTQVPDSTTENAAFGPLLDQLGDLEGKVITADAAHTNAENARDVVDDHHGHYFLALKGNQPSVEATVKALPGGSFSP